MANMITVKVRTITETEKSDGYVVTVDEIVEGTHRKTAFGKQKAPQFGQSFSTKVLEIGDLSTADDAEPITFDLDDFDQVENEFEITDPNSDRYGETTTKTWLFPK